MLILGLSIEAKVEKWKCEFIENSVDKGTLKRYEYQCMVQFHSVNDPNTTVEYFGDHKPGKTNADVVTIEYAWDTSNITYLPLGYLKTFPNLKHLNMGRTNVKYLKPEAFKDATGLIAFESYNNRIQTLESRVFEGAPNLLEINLSTNLIEVIDRDAFSRLSNLKVLSLDNNLLLSFEPLTFHPLKSIVDIALGLNKIEYLQGNLFEGNPKLKNLTLQNNTLSLIEPGAFDIHQNLSLLDLQFNPCINKLYTPPDPKQLNIDLKNCLSFGFAILRIHQIERGWETQKKDIDELKITIKSMGKPEISSGITIFCEVIGSVLVNLLVTACLGLFMYKRLNRKLECILTMRSTPRVSNDNYSYYEEVDGEDHPLLKNCNDTTNSSNIQKLGQNIRDSPKQENTYVRRTVTVKALSYGGASNSKDDLSSFRTC
jgi:hypothetical protein